MLLIYLLTLWLLPS